jgi:hypothetical protein
MIASQGAQTRSPSLMVVAWAFWQISQFMLRNLVGFGDGGDAVTNNLSTIHTQGKLSKCAAVGIGPDDRVTVLPPTVQQPAIAGQDKNGLALANLGGVVAAGGFVRHRQSLRRCHGVVIHADPLPVKKKKWQGAGASPPGQPVLPAWGAGTVIAYDAHCHRSPLNVMVWSKNDLTFLAYRISRQSCRLRSKCATSWLGPMMLGRL